MLPLFGTFMSGGVSPYGFTWNPADKSGNVTLSNRDLTATAPAVAGAARGTKSKASGKWYFEVKVDVIGTITSIGVMTSSGSLGAYIGQDPNGWGYVSNVGEVRNNSGTLATYTTFTSGDYIGVSVDIGANRLWFSKNGSWNGNPAGGTGALFLPSDTYFPAASCSATSAVSLGGIVYPPPTGFALWA